MIAGVFPLSCAPASGAKGRITDEVTASICLLSASVLVRSVSIVTLSTATERALQLHKKKNEQRRADSRCGDADKRDPGKDCENVEHDLGESGPD